MTEKTFFERLYVVSGLTPIDALCKHALGAHTPTTHTTTIFRFLSNCFPEQPLNYFVSTIHQVIWPIGSSFGRVWRESAANFFGFYRVLLLHDMTIVQVDLTSHLVN